MYAPCSRSSVRMSSDGFTHVYRSLDANPDPGSANACGIGYSCGSISSSLLSVMHDASLGFAGHWSNVDRCPIALIFCPRSIATGGNFRFNLRSWRHSLGSRGQESGSLTMSSIVPCIRNVSSGVLPGPSWFDPSFALPLSCVNGVQVYQWSRGGLE